MREAVSRLEGLFVGQLNDDEMALFKAAVQAGIAYESFEGVAGFFLGLGKVRLR